MCSKKHFSTFVSSLGFLTKFSSRIHDKLLFFRIFIKLCAKKKLKEKQSKKIASKKKRTNEILNCKDLCRIYLLVLILSLTLRCVLLLFVRFVVCCACFIVASIHTLSDLSRAEQCREWVKRSKKREKTAAAFGLNRFCFVGHDESFMLFRECCSVHA